jgi:hypothetical protein
MDVHDVFSSPVHGGSVSRSETMGAIETAPPVGCADSSPVNGGANKDPTHV